MRKKLFLIAILCLGFGGYPKVKAQTIEKDVVITHLEKDSFYNFHFVNDVNVKSEFDREKKLWKVRLEEVLDRKSLPEPHVETLWLKLDEDCNPKYWELDKFKINRHNFTVFLLKKKSQK